MRGQALEILRQLAALEPGKMRAGDSSYCDGYADGSIKTARELLRLLETPPDNTQVFRRRHYILWSHERFPTISLETGIFMWKKSLEHVTITASVLDVFCCPADNLSCFCWSDGDLRLGILEKEIVSRTQIVQQNKIPVDNQNVGGIIGSWSPLIISFLS